MRGVLDRATRAVKRRRAAADNQPHPTPLARQCQTREDWSKVGETQLEEILAAIQDSQISQALRLSRWGYATANAAHILGIALLVGAIVPLNLRLLGAWAKRPLPDLARVLVPMAITGATLAVLTGMMLFTVRAKRYADVEFLQAKLVLVATGLISAVVFHAAAGWWLERAGPRQRRIHAAISLVCWIGALLCGRYIAYAGR